MMPKSTLLIILALCALVVCAQTTGKCVPFPKFNLENVFTGYHMPVCKSILETQGITHYWVNDADLPLVETLPEGMQPQDCYDSMAFKYDTIATDRVHAFEYDAPTATCQNVIHATFCFLGFKACDPAIDVGTELVTNKKVCKWVCDLFLEEIGKLANGDGEVCTHDDLIWFQDRAMPWLKLVGLSPKLNCNNADYYAEEGDEDCVAPQQLSSKPVAPRCEQYEGTFCANVFSDQYNIYIPGAVTQADMESRIQEFSYFFNILPTDNQCSASFLSLICQSVFRECLDVGVKMALQDRITGIENSTVTPLSTRVAYGLNPPLSSCTSFNEACSTTPFFKELVPNAETLLNCANTDFNPSKCFLSNDTRTQRSVAPTPASFWNFNSKSYFGDYEYEKWYTTLAAFPAQVFWGVNFAASPVYADANAIPFIECRAPTVLSPNTGSTNIYQGRCALPCPTPTYTRHERSQISTAARAFSILALIFSGLLSLNFLIFKSQRHKTILFWFTLSYFMAALMIFLGLIITKDGSSWNLHCESPSTYVHMKDFGLFQGMFLVFFLLASMAWWGMQAVDLYQRLIAGQQFRKGSAATFRRKLAMHLFCWGVPAICVFALLVGGQIGYDTYLPFAFIASDRLVTSRPIQLYILFFIPVLAIAVTSYILVAIVLIYLAKYDPTGGLKKFQDNIEKSKSFWFKFTQSLKLFGFSLLMVLFIILLIVHVVTVANRQDDWDIALIRYAEQLVGYDPTTAKLESRYPPGLIILTVFGFCSPGFFMFILYFICSAEVYGLWAGLFYYKLGVTFFKSIAREDTSTGTGSAGTGSSHGSSTGKNTHSISGDLLTGGGDTALTGRRADSGVNDTKSDTNFGSETTQVLSVSNVPSASPKQHASSVPRKSTLFKGFKANKVPLEAPSRNAHTRSSSESMNGGLELSFLKSHSNVQSILQEENDTTPVVVIVEERHDPSGDHEDEEEVQE